MYLTRLYAKHPSLMGGGLRAVLLGLAITAIFVVPEIMVPFLVGVLLGEFVLRVAHTIEQALKLDRQ